MIHEIMVYISYLNGFYRKYYMVFDIVERCSLAKHI